MYLISQTLGIIKPHPNHSFVKVNDNEKILTVIKLKWRGFISTFSSFGFIPVASKSDSKRLQQQFSTLIPGACGLFAGGLCCVNAKMLKLRSYNSCTLTLGTVTLCTEMNLLMYSMFKSMFHTF